MDYDYILNIAKKMIPTNKVLPLFRVDPCDYEVGSDILPKGTYQEKMCEKQLMIEESLSRTNPFADRFQRKDCVFLFDDIKNAILFWKKKNVNVNIYKVHIELDNILHRGDMNYLDFLQEVVRNAKGDSTVLDSYSKRYWDTDFASASPCFEYLVGKASVEEIVVKRGSEDAQNLIAEIKGFTHVQLTDKYKELVNRYY